MGTMESITINGSEFGIEWVLSKNRNAVARLKGYTLVVSVPSRWSRSDREKIGNRLLNRAIKSIEKGQWHPEENRKLEFHHGQRLSAMGKEFLVLFRPSKRFGGRLNGRIIEVDVAHGKDKMRTAAFVKRELIKALLPELKERVEHFKSFFDADIPGVKIRDHVSRWGCCAPNGEITLSLRLLFMPTEILDYVIVHELAHTRYRSHGVRFWGQVERVIPDHKKRRKWLRNNGWKYPPKEPREPRKSQPSIQTRLV